ncbi:MAG TPA: hypothetical protein VM840_04015 [Actinomycetota bacterium]|nr:hypothetical protein [Actinomycetota bacterium]
MRGIASFARARGAASCAVVLLLAITSCGRGQPPGSSPAPTARTPLPPRPGPDQVYEWSGTVIEAPGREPNLCVGGVMESLPPQCGGLQVRGWTWDGLPGVESQGGTTWGDAYVRGTYDGDSFTLVAPPEPPRPVGDPPPEVDLRPACEDPQAVDPQATGWRGVPHEDVPGLAALWVTDPRGGEGPYVVSAIVRPGSRSEAERVLRSSWRGHLCVVERDQPLYSHLLQVQERAVPFLRQLGETPWVGSPDQRRGVVVVTVTVAHAELQARLDEEFGAGVVELRGVLQPV